MTETEGREALPGVGDIKKPLKVLGSEIDNIVITPKNAESPVSGKEAEGQEASKDKPVKISGENLDYLELVPKGVKKEEEKGEKPGDNSMEEKKAEQLSEQLTELEGSYSKLKEENGALISKIQVLDKEKIDGLTEQVVTLRLDKGLIKDDEVAPSIKELSELGEKSLRILLSDVKKQPKIDGKGAVETKVKFSDSNHTEEELARFKMLGYYKAGGDE